MSNYNSLSLWDRLFAYMRLVLINNVTKMVTVYENKTPLASYKILEDTVITKEEIEEIRTLDYKDKA